MYCRKCGTQIGEGAEFCHKCGTKVVYENTTKPMYENVTGSINENAVKSAESGGTIAAGQEKVNMAAQDDAGSFKKFVDEFVRSGTKFSSAEDLITNSKPWGFVWICVGIPAFIGLLLGAVNGMLLQGLLVFGGFFGYVAVFFASGIIRRNYAHKFYGESDQEINIEDFLAFLDGYLKMLSPYFHECGYLSERGGGITTVSNAVSKRYKEVKLCCECGAKKKNMAIIIVRPDIREQARGENTGKMQYIVGAVHNGFLIDGGLSGFLAHACLIRTAPILRAATMYYLKEY